VWSGKRGGAAGRQASIEAKHNAALTDLALKSIVALP